MPISDPLTQSSMELIPETAITTEYFEDLYSGMRDPIHSRSSIPMNRDRDASFEKFLQLGIPNTSSESYRYTDLSKFFRQEFNTLFAPKPIQFEVEDIFRCDVPDLDTTLILLVNGFFHGQERLVRQPNGLIYGSLMQACREMPALVAEHYNRLAARGGDALSLLNTAFANDGLFIYLPADVQESKPIQVINLLLSEEPLMVHHRNLVVMEKNSTLQLVVCDHSLSPRHFFTNSVYEFLTKEDARLDVIRMQNESNLAAQVSSSFFRQEARSRVISNTITLHGGFIRNNFFVELAGEQAENQTLGLFLADKKQQVSNFTLVDHQVPKCTSHQRFKGVIDDQANGSFIGKILVRRDAQETLAYQATKNLLLTDQASMKTKPQLEIYADDVKCSHGATVGQLDENAMFYLRSRGISYPEARLLMMYGFAHEIIDKITILPLRERIDHMVDLRLRGELSRCHNCPMNCC
jgi:Fe-S cluster assembly protein SufD